MRRFEEELRVALPSVGDGMRRRSASGFRDRDLALLGDQLVVAEFLDLEPAIQHRQKGLKTKERPSLEAIVDNLLWPVFSVLPQLVASRIQQKNSKIKALANRLVDAAWLEGREEVRQLMGRRIAHGGARAKLHRQKGSSFSQPPPLRRSYAPVGIT